MLWLLELAGDVDLVMSSGHEGCPPDMSLSGAHTSDPELKANLGLHHMFRPTEPPLAMLDHLLWYFEHTEVAPYCQDQFMFNELLMKVGQETPPLRWHSNFAAKPEAEPAIAALDIGMRFTNQSVWPRDHQGSPGAYADWPQNANSQGPSSSSFSASSGAVCLYHPWIQHHESHSEYFQRHGMRRL